MFRINPRRSGVDDTQQDRPNADPLRMLAAIDHRLRELAEIPRARRTPQMYAAADFLLDRRNRLTGGAR